jgi:hypothetical protein
VVRRGFASGTASARGRGTRYGSRGLDSRFEEVEFAHHGCPAGSVAEVASVPQAEHRDDGGIVLADGSRQPICYGVEITEYPVVSGKSAGSAEGIGLELLGGQTVADVAASDYGEIGVVADLFGLPEMAAVVSGHVRQAGAQGHFEPLERPQRSLGSGQVEAVGFLNELA